MGCYCITLFLLHELFYSIFSIILTLQEKFYTATKCEAKQNLRFKPHRITATTVETWISPVSTERLSHYDYYILSGNSNQRNTIHKNHGTY